MWNDTAFTERVGIRYPIVQGPFGGGVSSAALVAAVSNAGGLGSFGANALPPDRIADVAADIRERTDKPFAFNLWVNPPDEPTISPEDFARALEWAAPYYRELRIAPPDRPERFAQDYHAQVDAVLAAKPPVFSFVFGLPAPELMRQCKARGIFTIGTATTVDEAIALENCGVSAVVATGFEAGGHRASFHRSAEESLAGTLALVPQVVDAVSLPVIAAGGIADARGVVASLALGASAVQIGTAFLACDESGAAAVHREALFGAEARHTTLTRVFSGRLVRAIPNRYMNEMAARAAELLPYPAQNWLSGTLRAAATAQGRPEYLSLQAGQSASLVRHRAAHTLLQRIVEEVPAAISRISGH
jgi:nitronate monooxygenase